MLNLILILYCNLTVPRRAVPVDEREHESESLLVVISSALYPASHGYLADETSQELLWGQETRLNSLNSSYLF